MAIDFEFDSQKSARNKDKHGIDFIQAQTLWNDPRRIEARLPVREEMRYAVIGKIDAKHWTAIITYRGAKLRIISVRAAQATEIQQYGKASRLP